MSFSESALRHFKALLLMRRDELLRASAASMDAEKVVELDQSRVGRLSRMDALQAQAMSLETGRRLRQHIIRIDAALERFKDNEYGRCFECDEKINPLRLEADPAATLCIGCAQAQE